MKRIAVILILCLLAWIPKVFAQNQPTTCNYYIDNSSTGCGGGGCSDANAGTTLATAFLNVSHISSVTLSAGQTICLAGQSNPNGTNGGIWRAQTNPSVTGTGSTGWGPGNQISITSLDPTNPAILTAARCYGKKAGLCTGDATSVTWTQCGSNDANCHNSTAAGITNVYWYARANAATAPAYVDDPDAIHTPTLWGVSSKMMYMASGVPGAGSSRASNRFQGDMTQGTIYDDGTNLYAWMFDNSNPSTHILEVPTTATSSSLLLVNGTSHDYVYMSYLKFLYYPVAGIWWSANTTGATNHLWVDHVQCGGQGQGPVTNETGYYAACALFQSTNSSTPSGAVSAPEIHITNSTANWCGSHNCFGIDGDGPGGTEQYIGNVAGTAEHSQFDTKCAGGFNIFDHNIAHDSWTGTVIGSDPTQNGQNAYYSEPDWSACTGGVLTLTNNIGYNVNIGIYCNAPNNGATPLTKTCKMYNNTMILNPGLTPATQAYFFSNSNSSNTMVGDVQNNIAVVQTSNGEGFAWSTGGLSNTLTEKNNLYYNTTGLTNLRWASTDYTTLANWQSNCGGGSGICGSPDYFQLNPLGDPNVAISLLGSSPAIGIGNSLVGNTVIGAAPVSGSAGYVLQQRSAGAQ